MSIDLDTLTGWNSDWAGLKVAVFGLGATGFSVADTLTELGCEVLVVAEDNPADEERARLIPVIGARLLTEDLTWPPEGLIGFEPDLVVASPGFRPDHALIRWAAEGDIPVWGDVELAWRVRDKVSAAAWLLVTGTNGKTTTTQLAAAMLREGGLRVAPCGNIGVPVLDAVRDPAGFDYFVVELSSFQLHYLAASPSAWDADTGLLAHSNHPGGAGVGRSPLAPVSAVCLNIADDHLDWHGGREAYIAAKALVYENVSAACVYNKSDRVTEDMVREADVREGARAIGVDLGIPGPSDLGLVEGILVDRAFHEDRHHSALELITVQDLAVNDLQAPHLVIDVLAAAALARSVGVSPEAVHAAVSGFRADRHRVETVLRAGEVTWVDDSKATNAHAAVASLQAFTGIVWIVGGLLKGAHLDDVIAEYAPRLSGVVLIGAERDELRDAFARHAPAVTLLEVETSDTGEVMPVAVEMAAELAYPGDTVLLAPAAASMDQFVSYSDRGERFARAVIERFGEAADERTTDGPAH